MAIPRLTITRDQFEKAMDNLEWCYAGWDDPVLLDERSPDGEITTILAYDEDSVMIQKIRDKEGFLYNILPLCEFCNGDRVEVQGGDEYGF